MFHDASMNFKERVSNSNEVIGTSPVKTKRKMKPLKFSDIHGM